MTTAVTPLLSIGIPTYNRSHFLDSAIVSLISQIETFAGEVELVVSDNCSSDSTPEVVSKYLKCPHFRYFRNEQNRGMAANFHLCAERAAGVFVWMIGDDDLARPSAVARVLDVLRNRPHLDFIFVNASTCSSELRSQTGSIVDPDDYPNLTPAVSEDLGEREVMWNELISPKINRVFLGSLMVCIIRRENWVKGSEGLDFTEPFGSSLASVYPHSVIFARTLAGKKAYYLGEPCLIAFWGHQEWKGHLPVISAYWLHRLLDLYAESGVEPWRIRKCRRQLLLDCGEAVIRLKADDALPGAEMFSFRRYLKDYWKFKEFWAGTFVMPLLRRLRALFVKRRVASVVL